MNPSKQYSSVNRAELDANILHIICIKLALIFDFISFRAVCKRWRSATTPLDLPLQFPLLIECHGSRHDTELDVYSLQTRKIYTLNVPQMHGKYLHGHSHGYVPAYRPDMTPSPSLINPFTGSQLHLHFTNFFNIITACLGPSPTRKVGDAIIYMEGRNVRPNGDVPSYVGSWDLENKKWTRVEVPCGITMAYYKEKLYLHYRMTQVIDITTGAVLSNIQCPADVCFSNLIVTPHGLMGVQRLFLFIGGRTDMEDCRFVVHQLEDEDEKPHWVKMNEIGNLMLFVGLSNGICLSASDFDGFIGNCIYSVRSNKSRYSHQTYVGRYDLGQDRTEVVDSACTRSDCEWIVPSLC